MSERPTCPACGSQAIPIVYGLPGPGGLQAAERGDVVLGGCMVRGDDPQWGCRNGHRF